MRLAAYNVENLFDRPIAMNLEDRAEGDAVLKDFAELNALLGRSAYRPADKARMVALLTALGLERSDTGPYAILRRNRGALLRRPQGGGVEVIADGRADWAGSLELREEPIDAVAMQNTAQAIIAVNADVLGVVEAEHRPSLKAFNDGVIRALGGTPYYGVMVIDGNDTRGIDVGLMAREGFRIGAVCSHVDDRPAGGGEPIFSRDCPDYRVTTPGGARLHVLVNHLKSKGGVQRVSNARRLAQATRVAEIYRDLVADGAEHVAVIGDLNDTPEGAPLAPLLGGTDLRDAFLHPAFDDGGFPGTFGSCGKRDKIDYLLLSPALFARVTGGGVERRAMWPGVRPKRWEVFPELEEERDVGSDHAAIWVDLDLD
jgi:endonuclease/exonuclease/phosphatase family metal-dependent hydrolase